jgi:hypothetical protein
MSRNVSKVGGGERAEQVAEVEVHKAATGKILQVLFKSSKASNIVNK